MTDRYFYQHLIDLNEIHNLLNQVELEESERQKLLDTIHHTIHLEVVKFVLDELPKDQHHEFLATYDKRPTDNGIIVFLRRSITNLDHRLQHIIHQVVSDFKDTLHDYLRSSEEYLAGI